MSEAPRPPTSALCAFGQGLHGLSRGRGHGDDDPRRRPVLRDGGCACPARFARRLPCEPRPALGPRRRGVRGEGARGVRAGGGGPSRGPADHRAAARARPRIRGRQGATLARRREDELDSHARNRRPRRARAVLRQVPAAAHPHVPGDAGHARGRRVAGLDQRRRDPRVPAAHPDIHDPRGEDDAGVLA